MKLSPNVMRERSEATNKAIRIDQDELRKRPPSTDPDLGRARRRCAKVLDERDRLNKLHGRKRGAK